MVNVCLEQTGLGISGVVTPGHHHAGDRQQNERYRHQRRRFDGMLVNVVVARLAGECHVPHAEHVKRRDAGCDQRQQEQQHVTGWVMTNP